MPMVGKSVSVRAKLARRYSAKGKNTAEAKTSSLKNVKAVAEAKEPMPEDPVADAFMRSAATSALAGVRLGHGGPFGCSIVRDGVIIACAHNMVLHRKDPSGHAEMNAIQQACQAIGSHDLSDCDLYTTCEPCPMCWGAVQWARLAKVHIGVDRHTAAKYGFDDKVFYDEIDAQAGCYGLSRCGHIDDTSKDGSKAPERVHKKLVQVYDGLLADDVKGMFTDPCLNRTMRRRFGSRDGMKLAEAFKEVFSRDVNAPPPPLLPTEPPLHQRHEDFMQLAITAAQRGARAGQSKEREPFGAVIVKDGSVVAEAFNTVLESRDATATAEVNAIRAATQRLGTHSLEGCDMYSTSHPDLMSLGAILWARISRVYCGVTQQIAAQCGFEEGILHLKDLVEDRGRKNTVVVERVAYPQCENVFKEWSDRNGVIY